jgi:hypothetical protein
MNEKNVVLLFKGGQFTAKMLARGIKAVIKSCQGEGITAKVFKTVLSKGRELSGKGRMSAKQLISSGQTLEKIDVSGKEFDSFRNSMKKFKIDYTEHKIKETGHHTVLFKAKDKSIFEAVKDYSEKATKKERPPIAEKMKVAKEKVQKQHREKTKTKDRGLER